EGRAAPPAAAANSGEARAASAGAPGNAAEARAATAGAPGNAVEARAATAGAIGSTAEAHAVTAGQGAQPAPRRSAQRVVQRAVGGSMAQFRSMIGLRCDDQRCSATPL